MCVIIGTYSLVTAVIICLGYNVFYFDLKLPNGSVGQLLDLADYISNSFLMPFISLLTSILIGWVIGPKWITDEVTKNGESFKREKLYGIFNALCRSCCNVSSVFHVYWTVGYHFLIKQTSLYN